MCTNTHKRNVKAIVWHLNYMSLHFYTFLVVCLFVLFCWQRPSLVAYAAPIFSAGLHCRETVCPGAPEADEPVLPVLIGNYSIWQWGKKICRHGDEPSVLSATLPRPSREGDSIFWAARRRLPRFFLLATQARRRVNTVSLTLCCLHEADFYIYIGQAWHSDARQFPPKAPRHSGKEQMCFLMIRCWDAL